MRWNTGKIKEVPGVFSQGETLAELKANIADAYRTILETEDAPACAGARTLGFEIEV